MRGRIAGVVLALTVVLAGCVAAPTQPTPLADVDPSPTAEPFDDTTPTDQDVEMGPAPPDPATDRLGWEAGYWFNESIDVRGSDGLNESELDAVVGRSMARVETIRELEFEKRVPVRVISRKEYTADLAGREYSTANRLHQNVKWEAMFMVGEDTNAIETQQSTQSASVGGYYSPGRDEIVIVYENVSTPKMNEVTLAQELFHALQVRHFDVTEFNQSTRELHNAKDGIIEGDANLVDQFYQQRCDEEWACVLPSGNDSSGGGSTASIHWGMYLVTLQPYVDGPPFVRGIYKRGGWDAVNSVYENPPASTEQTIHPGKYPDDEPTEMSFSDRSGSEWDILQMDDSVNYASFGEAGLATMLFYPFYASGRTAMPIVSGLQFFNYTASGTLNTDDPITYTTEYTTGWDGDRLYPYVNDTSAATNETGYVWKSVWDSAADARSFADGVRQLVEFYGGTSVADAVYRIADGPHADAYSLTVDGATVYVVNAPSVAELEGVRRGAGPAF